MKHVYAVEVCSFSCDIMSETWIVGYFSSRDKAETFILEHKLFDKGYESVYVQELELDTANGDSL